MTPKFEPMLMTHRFDLGSARDVGLHGNGASAGRAQRCRNLLGLIHVSHIVHGDVCTFSREHLGDASPDASRRASDKCDFVLQPQGIFPSNVTRPPRAA